MLAQRAFTAPFDLGTDSPLRITLVRTGSDEHVLLLAAHHIAWDDASWRVFFADLSSAYDGGDLPSAPPLVEAPASGNDDADVEYWRALLADPPEPLELPGPRDPRFPPSGGPLGTPPDWTPAPSMR